jgi:hypothetical protein
VGFPLQAGRTDLSLKSETSGTFDFDFTLRFRSWMLPFDVPGSSSFSSPHQSQKPSSVDEKKAADKIPTLAMNADE